jgi:hypothetical protein
MYTVQSVTHVEITLSTDGLYAQDIRKIVPTSHVLSVENLK